MKQHNVNTTIDSCTFDNLTDTQAKDAEIISTEGDYSANATILFINNTVSNFQNAGNNTGQGAIVHIRNWRFTGINNTFVNITTATGNGFVGMYGVDNGALVNLSLTYQIFRNISNRGNGGAIHTISTKNFTLTLCTFELCTTAAKGGAIYINNTGIFTFVDCKFLGNTATGGGNDIGHQLNIQDSYSSSNFRHTCSSSQDNKITFADTTNLNHLLLGMSVMIVIVLCVLLGCSFQHV
jgi:hypothetical protein